MAFEFIKEYGQKDYILDKDRGLKLWKSAGGSGFRAYTLEVSDKKYLIYIEEKGLGNTLELWTIEDIHQIFEGSFKTLPAPPEVYDLALEAVKKLKDLQWTDMKDTIIVELSEKFRNLGAVHA